MWGQSGQFYIFVNTLAPFSSCTTLFLPSPPFCYYSIVSPSVPYLLLPFRARLVLLIFLQRRGEASCCFIASLSLLLSICSVGLRIPSLCWWCKSQTWEQRTGLQFSGFPKAYFVATGNHARVCPFVPRISLTTNLQQQRRLLVWKGLPCLVYSTSKGTSFLQISSSYSLNRKLCFRMVFRIYSQQVSI